MIVHSHSRSRSHSRRLIITLLALTTLLGIFWLNTRSENNDDASWRQKLRSLTVPARNSRRVTKVSMLYGSRNTLYERALQSHRRHAERWGYGMEVLQNDIAVGYWNKPSYLLSLVIEELAKPVGEQVEWFMWVDADTVVINPAIPLEIFLPPFEIEDIHMIATKDHKGLNTGIFFLRVHQKTVDILIKTLGYPIYNPKVALGVQVDQTAMEKVLSQPALKNSVMYLPRTWINTYEWAHAYEGERGNFLVHFPGLGDQRWAHMDKWLDIVEQTPEAWEVPVNETWYLDDSSAFWDRVLTAKKIIWEHEKALAATKGPVPMSSRNKQMERAVGELQKVLSEEPYSDKLMDQRIKDCNLALERR